MIVSMEMSILLTVFLILILLEGLFFQEGKICLIGEKQIFVFSSISPHCKNGISEWAVKLILKGFCLLNVVILNGAKKATRITLIQPQNLKLEG
ncbi:MAG: hypothetical protein Q4A76_07715 [Porphyromonadaceae bacterium]|nr:hypothetical protein [Porphyromonadaceae bacterium]